MKTLTNYTAGPRGINLKDGTTLWIEPGQSVEVEADTINGALPDLGKPGDGTSEQSDEIDALRRENEELRAELAALLSNEDGADLSKLKVDELKDLAAKEEIDLGDATKKDDIIAAIELAREAR